MNLKKVVFLEISQVLEQLLWAREVDRHIGVFIGHNELVLMLLGVNAPIFQSEGRIVKLLIIFVNLIHTFFPFEIDCTFLGVD
jgi:hypothetical protein